VLVPTVPTFTAGSDPTYTTLNQLGYAVSFLLQPPKAVLQQVNASPVSGGQSISSVTATAIIWNSTVVDNDSGFSASHNTRYTVATPGYWLCEGTWQSTAELTATYRGAYFRQTYGAGNPGGAGNTFSFGASREANVTSASGVNYTAVGTAMLSPYLYIGDYIELIAYSGAAETTGFTDGGSMMSLTLVSI
jgi:hypothetical protein